MSTDDVLQLKGRAACCIEAADELLTTEVVVSGVLHALSVAETTALVTCLLTVGGGVAGGGGTRGVARRAPDSVAAGDASAPPPLTAGLEAAVRAVGQTASRLASVLRECDLGDEAPPAEVSVELVPAVYAWANGASFEQCWLLSPSTYEGTLVRCLRSLEEMLKQLGEAATVLGDEALRSRFKECAAAVHRGIVFTNSLYLQE